MTEIVLLGGNGYIGRNVTNLWLSKDPNAEIYALSRSGKSSLHLDHLHNLQVDCTDAEAIEKAIPAEKIDYIVDLIGRPESDPAKSKQINDAPADAMLKVAKDKNVMAMGFIGGILGPKKFVKDKAAIAKKLQESGIRTVVVNPTVVYGNGRSDSTAKMVPLLKFFGLFSHKFKPVHVNLVVNELVEGMVDGEN